ncbi:MAG: hypothetical protein K1Y36_24775 [Blastocatellia bacterium]|nr:hypothetical protein [Blastocatellia bacterium]
MADTVRTTTSGSRFGIMRILLPLIIIAGVVAGALFWKSGTANDVPQSGTDLSPTTLISDSDAKSGSGRDSTSSKSSWGKETSSSGLMPNGYPGTGFGNAPAPASTPLFGNAPTEPAFPSASPAPVQPAAVTPTPTATPMAVPPPISSWPSTDPQPVVAGMPSGMPNDGRGQQNQSLEQELARPSTVYVSPKLQGVNDRTNGQFANRNIAGTRVSAVIQQPVVGVPGTKVVAVISQALPGVAGFPKGSKLIGVVRAAQNKRLYLEFQQAVSPAGAQLNVSAQAIDAAEGQVGVKGVETGKSHWPQVVGQIVQQAIPFAGKRGSTVINNGGNQTGANQPGQPGLVFSGGEIIVEMIELLPAGPHPAQTNPPPAQPSTPTVPVQPASLPPNVPGN